MSKIVIDARESGTTTGRYIDKLVEYLYKIPSDHSFTILTKTHRLNYLRSIAPMFTLVETPYKEFTFSEQFGFKSQIAALKPDLVHFCMVQQPVLYKGTVVTTMNDLTTIRFKNPSKNPVIFTAKQQVYKWVNVRAARKSSQLITYSEYVKQDVAAYTGVDPGKITVAHLAADAITEPAEPVLSAQDKQFILYVGRPQPHKNLWRLIESFEQLQKTHPNLHLVLAGKKDVLYSAMEQHVKEARIKNVIFTDFVSEGQLRWLYENTAAYIFPSLSEGFGLPGLEAMVHGAPVVSSNATCLPEVYKDGAHYFDPLDTADMTAKITEVLQDQQLRNNLIKRGRTIAGQYSWQRMAEQTLKVYEKALKQPV